MNWLRLLALCAVCGLGGCVRMPAPTESKRVPLAPLAPPPPISERFVNQQNAHEISQALYDEIERDRQARANVPAAPPSKSK